jgi:DNA-binding NtrC family response regulator
MEEIRYNGDFSKVIPIKQLEKQVIINALSITHTFSAAAHEVGVSERHIYDKMKEYGISKDDVVKLRIDFRMSGKKVRLRY